MTHPSPPDTGYKQLFSHPEFVQQLIEGFAPPEMAKLMDFTTLKNYSGHYITPLFEEKREDVVWSVQINWEDISQELFLYLLLELRPAVDYTMAIRLLHYLACFYDHLLKTRATTLVRGLPPVFMLVLYNGEHNWTAPQDLHAMIKTQLPTWLRPCQPQLRYHLVDQSAYTDAELVERNTPLSAIFSIENARNTQELQQAVERLRTLLQSHPDQARLTPILTPWLQVAKGEIQS